MLRIIAFLFEKVYYHIDRTNGWGGHGPLGPPYSYTYAYMFVAIYLHAQGIHDQCSRKEGTVVVSQPS